MKNPDTSRRLSHAEATQIEEAEGGRYCPGCRKAFPKDDVSASFGADKRTRTGLTTLCLSCLVLKDAASQKRISAGHAPAQVQYRRTLRDLRLAAAQAEIDALLPRHGIPSCALPGYPTPSAAPRGPRADAILSRLYSLLRDAPMATWEQLAGVSKRKIAVHLEKVGPRSLELIDEHLKAFDLDPLTP
jgi:hypothetical protein